MFIINDVLTHYLNALDSGFGLIGGDVRWLFNVLVMINVALSAMFWAFSDDPVFVHLARKVLFIGIFAWLIENWPQLTTALYDTFMLLGIKAGGGHLTRGELLDPGKIAQRAIAASEPIRQAISDLSNGPITTCRNLPEIVLLAAALLTVIAAFFIIALQAALAILLFKLGSLVTFVLVPFSLLNRTAFIAERPLGWLIAASVRIMLLAIVVGLGESIWDRLLFTSKDISIEAALDVALAAILFMLLALISSRMASDLAMGTARLGTLDATIALAAAGAAAGYASRPAVAALMPLAGWIKERVYGAGLSAVKAAASVAARASTPTPSSAPVPPATQKPPSTPTGGSS